MNDRIEALQKTLNTLGTYLGDAEKDITENKEEYREGIKSIN